MQLKTGYHHYINPFDVDNNPSHVDRGGDAYGLDKLDLTGMSKNVCGLAVNITTSALCLQRIVDLATFILEEAHSIVPELMANDVKNPYAASQNLSQDFVNANALLLQHVRSAKRRAEGLLAEAEAWKHKATILVQTLLSLTQQRDQNISIVIAQDSRTLAQKATRDSTSMKAIAAVTMCFLPGTFVSSLFAMPMFDWNAAPEHSIDRNFWIYWAVTIPLTCIVVVVWLIWTNKARLWKRLPKRKNPRDVGEYLEDGI